jgi:Secretion system C-terminal sorting domain
MNKIFTRRILLLAILAFGISLSQAQQLLVQDFNFTGNLTSNGWTAVTTGAGTNAIATTTGLTYTGFPGSGIGNAALVNNLGGEDDNITFTNQNTNGQNIYLSALVNVTDPAATKVGDYFLHLGSGGGTTFTLFASRVFAKITAGVVNFGLSNTSTATYGTTAFAPNTTYLIIVKYTISTAGSDPVSMWVLPSGVPSTEAVAGTPEVTNTTTAGQDAISAVALRQGSATNSTQTVVDGIRIGLTWADVTGSAPALPTLTASPNISGLITNSGVASSESSFGLSGANLTGFPGNITVTASTDIEISLSSGGPYSGSVLVPYSTATLTPAVPIYVRIAATAPAGAFSGSVTCTGGGDVDGAAITVSGNVILTEPTVQATNIIFSNIVNNGFDINWTNGNGSSRIVVVRQTATANVAPADGTNYAVSSNTGTGNIVVFSGTGTGPVTVTGLVGGTNYTVYVYEYNGSAGSNNYLISSSTGNPATTTTTGVSPLLQQINFTSVSTPLYGSSGTATRLPLMYYATVSGLSPNTTYRYYTQAGIPTDFGTAATGAGNSILIDYTAGPITYTYTSAASITTANNYGKFTTNASGSFRGAFGFVNTGNARFTAGNVVYPTIALGEDVATPSIQYRYALNEGITILTFATTAGANDGTFIKGASLASVGNVVGLWQSVDGNSIVAARPLSMTLVENPTFLGAPWAASFVTGYDLTAGSWNAIIPNANANGVRLVQQFNISTGAVVGCDADADGTWPDGAVTANPTGGTTAIQITSTDAPIDGGTCFAILPVKLSSFAVQKSGNTSKISWTTTQELNSREFVIERSANGSSWTTAGTVAAAGNSNSKLTYIFTDNAPAKGINFYRLKLVDADNRFTHSDIKSVLFSNADVVLITPNPASSFVNIYMSKNNNSLTQIIVTNANGKVVQKINTTEQTYQLPTGNYAKGLYVIKVISAETNSTQKVIIQ